MLAIDFAATIQVGRSYIIAYPLIVMGAVFLSRAWLAQIAWKSRPIARVAAAVLVAAFCVERADGLYQERRAFHGFDTVMSQFFGSGKTLPCCGPICTSTSPYFSRGNPKKHYLD